MFAHFTKVSREFWRKILMMMLGKFCLADLVTQTSHDIRMPCVTFFGKYTRFWPLLKANAWCVISSRSSLIIRDHALWRKTVNDYIVIMLWFEMLYTVVRVDVGIYVIHFYFLFLLETQLSWMDCDHCLSYHKRMNLLLCLRSCVLNNNSCILYTTSLRFSMHSEEASAYCTAALFLCMYHTDCRWWQHWPSVYYILICMGWHSQ